MMNKVPDLPYLVRSDGQEITIDKQLVIGRSPECSLQIENDLVSRCHAQIDARDDQFVLTDLSSHNGTWVNEMRITSPAVLKDGDRIRIGRTEFTFHTPAASVHQLAQDENAAEILPEEGRGTRRWDIVEPVTLVRLSDGAEIGLNRNLKVGRGNTNDLVINDDDSVSQNQAIIELQNGQVQVTDHHSRNGTWVNDKRISQPVQLCHADRVRFGNSVFLIKMGARPLPPGLAARRGWRSTWRRAIILTSLFAAVVIFGFLILPGILPILHSSPTASPTHALPSATATESQVQVTRRALHALVIVVNRKSSLTASIGSGSLIDPAGIILTNQHVIADGTGLILVGLNWQDPESQPNSYYRCEILGQDTVLDLAILRVVEAAEGDPFLLQTFDLDSQPLPDNLVFPTVQIGDSDSLVIGETITIIGFPSVGGQTATLTIGSVSGFLQDEELGFEKGWIKTDAEISHGNSGGMAIDRNGYLIGVPTLKTTGTDYLGFVRPINFALDLIRRACPACIP